MNSKMMKDEGIHGRLFPAGGDEGGAVRRRIAEKAYELFVRRGRTHGHDVDDWLQAERLVGEEIRAGARRAAAEPFGAGVEGSRAAGRGASRRTHPTH